MFSSRTIIKTLLKSNIILSVTCVKLAHGGNDVRVRFAPSPTGFLHLGGLRTALYNYLFARSKGGSFILRIEDTDQTRLVEGSVKQLQDDLKWAGIIPDEGPDIGGPYGPYLQSQRLGLYKAATETLIEKGAAYYCFCTPHRLELLRKDALRRREVPKYDNRCRNITKDQVAAKLQSGTEHCVRLKMVPGCDTFHDLVYGNITHDVMATEGDPVIMKTDGFPTYHLANVVDDHHMKISHVLRGVEWQSSTPKHLMLYKGFGWDPPQFAHLPLLLNADGTKLSKRQSDITVKHYRSADVFPQALVNFVTYSGGGFHRDNSDTVRSVDMEGLSAQFDLDLVGVASCKVSLDRLDDFNQVELLRQTASEPEMTELVSKLKSLLSETYKERSTLEDSYIRSVLSWSHKRISRPSQLAEPQFSYLWQQPPVIPLDDKQADVVSKVCQTLKSTSEFDQKTLSSELKNISKQANYKFKDFMHLMRLLLCGKTEGPAVAEMMEVLGKETSLNRMQASLPSTHST